MSGRSPNTRSFPETGAHLLAQVVEEGDALQVAICGPLVAARFKAAPTAATLDILAQQVARIAEAKGRVTLLILVTVPQAPAADPGLGVASESFIARFEGSILALAVVLTGAGFSSSVLREWTAVFVDAQCWPTRSFASLEGACGWLARRPDQATELNRARRLFEALAPSMGVASPTG